MILHFQTLRIANTSLIGSLVGFRTSSSFTFRLRVNLSRFYSCCHEPCEFICIAVLLFLEKNALFLSPSGFCIIIVPSFIMISEHLSICNMKVSFRIQSLLCNLTSHRSWSSVSTPNRRDSNEYWEVILIRYTESV